MDSRLTNHTPHTKLAGGPLTRLSRAEGADQQVMLREQVQGRAGLCRKAEHMA